MIDTFHMSAWQAQQVQVAFEEAPYPDKEGDESDSSRTSVTRFLRRSPRPQPCKGIPRHLHAFVDISAVISQPLDSFTNLPVQSFIHG